MHYSKCIRRVFLSLQPSKQYLLQRCPVFSKQSSTSIKETDLLALNNNTIIISQSHDIFENLAFEDWLYKNLNLSSIESSILLMWYNSPSVIIGRHQNPWTECSVEFCESSGINIVRRNSGGGTVYHDFGNINFSFMTSRKGHNRKQNLELLCNVIRKKWEVDLRVSQRDDILVNNRYKISGTAAKLGRNNAYHHCTVLVSVDEEKLHKALHRDLSCVSSKATCSTRADVINLKTVCPEMEVVDVMKAVSQHYKHCFKVKDENVLSIHPEEDVCSGLDTIRDELKSWEWRFGRTPPFTVALTFPIPIHVHHISNVIVAVTINKGLIESISLDPQILTEDDFKVLIECFLKTRFSIKSTGDSVDKWVNMCNSDVCYFVKMCIMETVSAVMR